MNTLLGGEYAPLGCVVAFLKCPAKEAIEATRNFDSVEFSVVQGLEFPKCLNALDPMEAPWTKSLFVDCGPWTAHLDNGMNGGDSSAYAPALSRSLNVDCVTAVNIPRYGPGHAQIQFDVSGPSGEPPLMGIRNITAHCADGTWSWYEYGKPFDFEKTEKYESKKIRDRLDRSLLVAYLRQLEINVDDSDFYGEATMLEQKIG